MMKFQLSEIVPLSNHLIRCNILNVSLPCQVPTNQFAPVRINKAALFDVNSFNFEEINILHSLLIETT